MTIVVAYTDGSDTWIGSDQLYVRGSQRLMVPGGKWLVHGGWALTSAGPVRHSFVAERHRREILAEATDPFDVTERLAKVYRENGITPKVGDDDRCDDFGPGHILARAGKLWDVDSTLTATEWPSGELLADGMGWQLAKGAAWQMTYGTTGVHPERIIATAIRAACALDPNTCCGFWQGKL